ncbi:hypothetical protein [Microcystis aeruginosa]|uniref:hypothetical protein n=1 Tax=Microcystis aeruginosa TaxID=1126 RepID=UPI001CA5A54A|nr:hypothetical protein [Microcystis aeruginosa]
MHSWHSYLDSATPSFNQCAWCVPQKSIAGAVEVTLGNAPYKIGDRTERFVVGVHGRC